MTREPDFYRKMYQTKFRGDGTKKVSTQLVSTALLAVLTLHDALPILVRVSTASTDKNVVFVLGVRSTFLFGSKNSRAQE